MWKPTVADNFCTQNFSGKLFLDQNVDAIDYTMYFNFFAADIHLYIKIMIFALFMLNASGTRTRVCCRHVNFRQLAGVMITQRVPPAARDIM